MVKQAKFQFNCTHCGNPSEKPRAWVKRAKLHFCSKACHDLWQALQNSVEKICKECGNPFRVAKCYAKRFSTCSKECQCNSRKREKNVKWNDGLSDTRSRLRANDMTSRKYRQWRKAVFELDDFTCQGCGQRGGDLEAHHIIRYVDAPDLRHNLINGLTLCKECHRKTHTKNETANLERS